MGHELSLIALRAAAIEVDAGAGDAARQAAAELRTTAARTTENLREVIGMLREDSDAAPLAPTHETIVALAQQAQASGLPVALDGELPALPPLADRAAYRVVQEALTNAAKHAPGSAVHVRLAADPDSGEGIVTVSNATSAGALAHPSGDGYGLVGLDERVRMTGGHLRVRRTPEAFEVTATLPVRPGADASPPDDPTPSLASHTVRRSMIDALWVPVVVTTVLAVALIVVELFGA